MGNLSSAAHSPAENLRFLEKQWISNFFNKIRQFRDEIRAKIVRIFFREVQGPVQGYIQPVAVQRNPVPSIPKDPNQFVRQRDLEIYQANIQNYISNEQKLVYAVCIFNVLFAIFICKIVVF